MKFAMAALAAIGALGGALLSPAPAEARFFGGHALEASSLVESAQVTVRTVRTVRTSRPSVVVRRVFRPAPVVRRTVVVRPGGGCRNVTTRVRTGNRVVVRTVRRCF